MQEIEKHKNGYGYDTFVIKTLEGSFEILFAPNGDLYWRYLSGINVLDDKEKQELTITKEESFKVIFEKSKKSQDGIFITYTIRFRNSGSRYNPFNINFMQMYNSLKEYDPNNHQIHIEEYLYKQNKLKKLIK